MRFVPRVLLLAALLWLALPAVASAHAHLVQADPAPSSVVAHVPPVASFVFDEPLNPVLTRVRVMDASGHRVTADTGHLVAGHGGELWELALPALPDGTYSVFWTSESATDGHVMSSFYTFRVAPTGGVAGAGAVTGAAAGAYGGGGGDGIVLGLGVGALATALLTWLGLMAQALWLGALAVALAVLAPAARSTATDEARLAQAAAPRVWALARWAPVVVVLALAGEVLSLAVQGTGGDWSRALDPDTLGGILSSQNGRYILLRFAVLLIALLLTMGMRVPAAATPSEARPRGRARRSPQALGIVAPGVALAVPRREAVLLPLASVYLLLVAFSGHAADVTPSWLSYSIDWLHLLCTATWAGGIAALAWGVLPPRRALPAGARVGAVLPLLDRFGPIAYLSVSVLVLSGLYNAVSHVETPARLTGTSYGQILIVKLVLVGVMVVLSASHAFVLRPRLARLQAGGARNSALQQGLGALAARLRLEGGAGAAVLLATALMGQTLPSAWTAVDAPGATDALPAAITGTAMTGNLRGQLTVAPPAVGSATFTLRLWAQGTPLTGDTAAAIIHLYPLAQSQSRATLDTVARGTRFVIGGSLAATGTWRADVLVRTATVADYRTLTYTFGVGPGAAFLAPDAAGITIGVTPGRISAANTFTIAGVQAAAVRLLSRSLDMQMGTIPYPALALGGGRWRVTNAYAPMNGRWGLTVQAQRNGTWTSLRQFVYQVPLSGPMRLLTPQLGADAGGSRTHAANLSGPYNVAAALKLPYTALVTEMGSDGVRRLGGPLLRTGVQAHGVDVLDGTPYAYVTNFGSEPGTVSRIDLRTMRVVRTFTVGLGPAHIIFMPDHRRAFVTDFRSSDLYVIDLRSGATTPITFPGGNCFNPHGIDISEDGRTLYVACAGGAWVYTVDTHTLRPGHTAVTGRGAFGVSVDGSRHEVWVTNQTDNDVTVLDERTLRTLATIPVGKGPALLVTSPDGRTVYVADQLGNALSVIDAARRQVTATIPVAAQPHGPDVTADGKYVYVASIGGNAVTIIRTADNRVVSIVPSATGSNEVAIAH